MNVVWPVCALFGGPILLLLYARHGRAAPSQAGHGGHETPFRYAVANGTLHCGSGCTLGDIVAEWLVFAAPVVAVWFGWHSLFGARIFAVWAVDYVFAYAFGIVFQYFTIAPMRNLSLGRGIIAAGKADTLSLTAWQIGMYGFMVFANFVIFRDWIGARLQTNTAVFWFMMQIAMLCGFATAYPVNWWLLRAGIKEPM
ncbi:MAG TPA: DUF4396 domain-containing protein [Acetobacteraceae bacterium]|nr:DUF4396 domain-containing protein [Acetobacteraceae bacterium]